MFTKAIGLSHLPKYNPDAGKKIPQFVEVLIKANKKKIHLQPCSEVPSGFLPEVDAESPGHHMGGALFFQGSAT